MCLTRESRRDAKEYIRKVIGNKWVSIGIAKGLLSQAGIISPDVTPGQVEELLGRRRRK